MDDPLGESRVDPFPGKVLQEKYFSENRIRDFSVLRMKSYQENLHSDIPSGSNYIGSLIIYYTAINLCLQTLLYKPYENEVTLTGQNPPSKCCQHLET